jgi:hypothetical protein
MVNAPTNSEAQEMRATYLEALCLVGDTVMLNRDLRLFIGRSDEQCQAVISPQASGASGSAWGKVMVRRKDSRQ